MQPDVAGERERDHVGDEGGHLHRGRHGHLHGPHHPHHLRAVGALLGPGLRDPVPAAAVRGPLPRVVQHLRLPLLLLPRPLHPPVRRRESHRSPAPRGVPGLRAAEWRGGKLQFKCIEETLQQLIINRGKTSPNTLYCAAASESRGTEQKTIWNAAVSIPDGGHDPLPDHHPAHLTAHGLLVQVKHSQEEPRHLSLCRQHSRRRGSGLFVKIKICIQCQELRQI